MQIEANATNSVYKSYTNVYKMSIYFFLDRAIINLNQRSTKAFQTRTVANHII
ncbi:MAG: hypothetical protein PWP16_1369 [Eubacteriaceae bacterium]|jgi:hypothetical protein|nr:hypothetical protein [Eubacteriaceae bacterium]MDN5308006.1 hypothetical protein [Eubacteriaceae bacterium]